MKTIILQIVLSNTKKKSSLKPFFLINLNLVLLKWLNNFGHNLLTNIMIIFNYDKLIIYTNFVYQSCCLISINHNIVNFL